MDPGDLAKVPKCQTLRGPDLLKILPPQTRLFESVSSSDSQSSELSGPFSDVVYTKEVESKRRAKQLYGKDLYTAFSFSSEFKSAIEELKKDMMKENPDYLKNESDIGEPSCIESEPSSVVYECVQFPGIDFEVEKEEEEEEEVEDRSREKENEKEKKKNRAKIWLDDDEAFDTMSGYWRLLSAFDNFRISPPWYDAYAEGQEHWLQTAPIPAEVLENSRRKCLNWLSKYFDNCHG